MTCSPLFEDIAPIPVQLIKEFPGNRKLFVRRDDLIHPLVNGNKWWKLKENFKAAIKRKAPGILSFGGAYSNHLYALAAAGYLCQIPTTGIIRGELNIPLNPTLNQATAWGMELFPVSRGEYRIVSKGILPNSLPKGYQDYFIIPEGGTNKLAVKGCQSIVKAGDIDFWCLSCGTGGTMAGVISALRGADQVMGFAALKGADFLNREVQKLLPQSDQQWSNWEINTDYHFGGYARYTPTLIKFMNDFRQKYTIPLDPIYTGKLLFGVMDLLEKGYFPENVKVCAIHSGGLQGVEGFLKNYGNPPI